MRSSTLATGAAGLFFILGCGGADLGDLAGGGMGGGSFENQAACTAWIEHHNSLSCMSMTKMDAAQTCPSSLDMAGLDMTSYYNCMQENTKCNGDIPDVAGLQNCTPPTP